MGAMLFGRVLSVARPKQPKRPPRRMVIVCPGCGRLVKATRWLCDECWQTRRRSDGGAK